MDVVNINLPNTLPQFLFHFLFPKNMIHYHAIGLAFVGLQRNKTVRYIGKCTAYYEKVPYETHADVNMKCWSLVVNGNAPTTPAAKIDKQGLLLYYSNPRKLTWIQCQEVSIYLKRKNGYDKVLYFTVTEKARRIHIYMRVLLQKKNCYALENYHLRISDCLILVLSCLILQYILHAGYPLRYTSSPKTDWMKQVVALWT